MIMLHNMLFICRLQQPQQKNQMKQSLIKNNQQKKESNKVIIGTETLLSLTTSVICFITDKPKHIFVWGLVYLERTNIPNRD